MPYFRKPPRLNAFERNWINKAKHNNKNVGDPASGKTCALRTYIDGIFPTTHISVYDSNLSHVVIDGTPVNLQLHDTIGNGSYDRLRTLVYNEVHIFVVMFSLINPSSLESVKLRWYPEIRHYCPEASILLVGTKMDLRKSDSEIAVHKKFRPISTHEGEKVAKQIKAKYMECSALTHKGLNEVFHEAIRLSLHLKNSQNIKQKKCVIL